MIHISIYICTWEKSDIKTRLSYSLNFENWYEIKRISSKRVIFAVNQGLLKHKNKFCVIFATPSIIFMPHCAKLWWSRQLVIEPVIHSITYEFLVVGNLLLCSEQKWRFAPSSQRVATCEALRNVYLVGLEHFSHKSLDFGSTRYQKTSREGSSIELEGGCLLQLSERPPKPQDRRKV